MNYISRQAKFSHCASIKKKNNPSHTHTNCGLNFLHQIHMAQIPFPTMFYLLDFFFSHMSSSVNGKKIQDNFRYIGFICNNETMLSTPESSIYQFKDVTLLCLGIFKNKILCGIGHNKRIAPTYLFSACRKRQLKGTGRGDWESPPLV